MGDCRRRMGLHGARKWLSSPHGEEPSGHILVSRERNHETVRYSADSRCAEPLGGRAYSARTRAISGQRRILKIVRSGWRIIAYEWLFHLQLSCAVRSFPQI